MSTTTLAGHLYQTYCEAVGGKTFNGDPLPDWPTFYTDPAKQKQSDAWLAVAGAAERQLMPSPTWPLPPEVK